MRSCDFWLEISRCRTCSYFSSTFFSKCTIVLFCTFNCSYNFSLYILKVAVSSSNRANLSEGSLFFDSPYISNSPIFCCIFWFIYFVNSTCLCRLAYYWTFFSLLCISIKFCLYFTFNSSISLFFYYSKFSNFYLISLYLSRYPSSAFDWF